MLGRTTARRAALGIRRCCACGYRGHFAQIDDRRARASGAHCPRCGCDFSERPPRSYAEMEGLDTNHSPSLRAGGDPNPTESRLVERWIGFVFVVVLTVALTLAFVGQMLDLGTGTP